jgi:TfoX/Sxy family transcriptional regulator of competence genes
MAFDEALGERVAAAFQRAGVDFQKKRMFGGLGFMVSDKMCIGIIVKNDLMVRVVDEKFADVLKMPDARRMDFTGRPMNGFVYVASKGLADEGSLDRWIGIALEFAKLGKVKSKRAAQK